MKQMDNPEIYTYGHQLSLVWRNKKANPNIIIDENNAAKCIETGWDGWIYS